MRKQYQVRVDAATIAFENIPPAFVRDWLLHHARQRLNCTFPTDMDHQYSAELTRAAMTVQRNWALKPEENEG